MFKNNTMNLSGIIYVLKMRRQCFTKKTNYTFKINQDEQDTIKMI